MDDLTSRALVLARTLLSCLTEAGYRYQLAGSLALHAHGVTGAAVTNDVRLFTEHHYWDSSPLRLAAEVLRQEGCTVKEGPAEPFPSGTCPVLRVGFLDGGHPLRVTLQRMPQVAPSLDVDGMATATPADCLQRVLNSLHAGSGGPVAFIDFDAVQAHAGQETFDRFVQAHVRHQTKQDPSVEPVRHYEQLHARLARVIRLPVTDFISCGHRAPDVLRQSVLQAALRMLAAAPGGSALVRTPLDALIEQHRAQIARQFDSAFPDFEGDAGMAAHHVERALAVEAAVLARTQAVQSRTRAPAGPSHPHPHTHQPPGHGSSPMPGR
ncbi:hypothetical protein ACFU7X_37360 [Streptomyces chartreusis]|uniref:hypothetical protein n=1 Tax=Streptomyces chartreusis TaxID=1969 RepID=UPI0036D1FDF5